ncbi:uracil-DNA glycosylase [Psychroflexus sp. ALD_RP9]|uniref:uracil-DNA glycosylase n=1 Tax=Psychroflexus sp. ALD_RP9 TaxID=2777186 RepID=UPI001A8C7F6E|nr:uracil-DNA glycosylase [Psychroflexus sp. ALD_RP9]QSS97257.1 uracil-DNA glycosylase [Psychroflexus sp. ALD_RP9]
MDVAINSNWKSFLKDEFEKPYFKSLAKFVKSEYKNHTCFPKGRDIFNAFEWCDLEDTKVVILGQDPYHGKNQAHGLAFSVPEGIKIPPSLQNIFRELKTDLSDYEVPNHGNLNHWARQGVLLLNATLTVRENEARSHQNKGWEVFTDAIIKKLSNEKEQLVFLLWGGFAKRKSKLINADQHLILTCGHPSPLSANRGYWFGNRHFSTTNTYLRLHQKQPIKW